MRRVATRRVGRAPLRKVRHGLTSAATAWSGIGGSRPIVPPHSIHVADRGADAHPSLPTGPRGPINLESSITDDGVQLHDDFAFRIEPVALDVLADAGVDVVTLANNPAVDCGPVGMADTLRAVRSARSAPQRAHKSRSAT